MEKDEKTLLPPGLFEEEAHSPSPFSPLVSPPSPPGEALNQMLIEQNFWRLSTTFQQYPMLANCWFHKYQLPEFSDFPDVDRFIFVGYNVEPYYDIIPYKHLQVLNRVLYNFKDMQITLAVLIRQKIRLEPDIDRPPLLQIRELDPIPDEFLPVEMMVDMPHIAPNSRYILFNRDHTSKEEKKSHIMKGTSKVTFPIHVRVSIDGSSPAVPCIRLDFDSTTRNIIAWRVEQFFPYSITPMQALKNIIATHPHKSPIDHYIMRL